MRIRRRSVLARDRGYEIAAIDASPENILEKIVWHKEEEVKRLQSDLPWNDLVEKVKAVPAARDFAAALRSDPHHPALIAEVKKASPSRGLLRADFDPAAIAQAYERGGAACLSVLTDAQFFQGSFQSLQRVRQAVRLPLLCKEFVIDPYQIYYGRLCGADAVLLIAAILRDRDLAEFLHLIHELGMAALVEVHTQAEMARVTKLAGVRLIGINNRNLETFTVNLSETQTLLAGLSPETRQQYLWVSESGLFVKEDLAFVANCGADAVLIGESLIVQQDIERATSILW